MRTGDDTLAMILLAVGLALIVGATVAYVLQWRERRMWWRDPPTLPGPPPIRPNDTSNE